MSKHAIENLIERAIALGATDAAIIPSTEIQVKESLAELCNGEYTCPNYGVAASCPPHVEGPAQFRKWQQASTYSIIIKIELPTSIMFSSERTGVMQLLHLIVSAIEHEAKDMGLTSSRGFAGGSCKELFCEDQISCQVVKHNQPCLHSDKTRPSISGFGIDAIQLMHSSGWQVTKANSDKRSREDDSTWVAGLILLA